MKPLRFGVLAIGCFVGCSSSSSPSSTQAATTSGASAAGSISTSGNAGTSSTLGSSSTSGALTATSGGSAGPTAASGASSGGANSSAAASSSSGSSSGGLPIFDAGAAFLPPEMRGRVYAGYQGWFDTPADDAGLGFSHWSTSNTISPSTLTVDLWPDQSEYGAGALATLSDFGSTGPIAALGDGSPSALYSASAAGVADLHMGWMQTYGIDGVFFQRFVTDMPLTERVNVLRAGAAAAEAHNRQFAVMYDVTNAAGNPACYTSGGTPNASLGSAEPSFSLQTCIEADWANIQDLTSSPAYLRVTIGGAQKPLVVLWGFGFNDAYSSGAPAGSRYVYNTADAVALIEWFQAQGFAVMGGVPTFWLSQVDDSLNDVEVAEAASNAGQSWPTVGDLYGAFDILSPWMVGRVSTLTGVDEFSYYWELDAEAVASSGQGYLPVIFPGYSFYNTANATAQSGFPLNQIPRNCGKFLWEQYAQAFGEGFGGFYVAMFDEVNEGTAIYKTAATAASAPRGTPLVTLDADGCQLPNDFYLQEAGAMSGELQGKQPISSTLPLAIPDTVVHSTYILDAGDEIQGPSVDLAFQNDGNLVLYDVYKNALWASDTSTSGSCNTGCVMAFQSDGNLVLYRNGASYWASNTNANPAATLVLSAGSTPLAIVSDAGAVLWSE